MLKEYGDMKEEFMKEFIYKTMLLYCLKCREKIW